MSRNKFIIQRARNHATGRRRLGVVAVAATGSTLLVAVIGATAADRRATPPATIQRTMDRLIDPAADALWGSVGTTETSHGEQRKEPRTPAEWRQVGDHARALVTGARALQRDHPPVGENGHGLLADADTPGIRTATQIRADIDGDPGRFRRAAKRLELAAAEAAGAAAARDGAQLLAAGASIDAACEACHSAYWYPRTPPRRLPGDDEFARRAASLPIRP